MLTELAKQIRFDNASKGFDPTEGGIERYFLLVVSEICEAQDELRNGHGLTYVYYEESEMVPGVTPGNFVPGKPKPCGFPVEIADAVIRILDIQAKMNYKILVIPGSYEFDPTVSIDSELLAVVSTVSDCFRKEINHEVKLNLALSALLQIGINCNFNMMNVIEEKLEYNRSRPPKHGRKF